MNPRRMSAIKRDLRNCWENAGVGRRMKSSVVEDFYTREAHALEREMDLRRCGFALWGTP